MESVRRKQNVKSHKIPNNAINVVKHTFWELIKAHSIKVDKVVTVTAKEREKERLVYLWGFHNSRYSINNAHNLQQFFGVTQTCY